jgi:hypothetical protein
MLLIYLGEAAEFVRKHFATLLSILRFGICLFSNTLLDRKATGQPLS